MKFRKRLFYLFALLAIGWIIYGVAATGDAVNETVTQGSALRTESQQSATEAGAALGGGLSLIFFLCTGFPALLFFGMLGWRNSAGIVTERRHQEQLEAARGQARPTG